MTMKHVTLPRPLVNKLLGQAQRAADNEVCGLIGAKGESPVQVYPVSNIANAPDKRFEMDPKEQIAAMKHMRKAGQELFAIYHSHPHSPAKPSKEDIDEAGYPETLYLIISMNTKGVLEMRGFRLKDRDIVEVNLAI